jgi:hypothetical protein
MISTPLWIQANVAVTSTGCNMDQGTPVVAYTPPHPQRGTGIHRYVWLALEQSEQCDASAILKSLEDAEWDSVRWLDHQTSLSPRAMAFHRASWTPVVSSLYANGRVQYAPSIVQSPSNGLMGQDGRVVVEQEPVFGLTIERSWEDVTQRLYKYAFK